MRNLLIFSLMLVLAFSFTGVLEAQVDLSDVSDTTVQSPSLANETPAGSAPGGPIRSIPEPDYNDLSDTVVV